MDGGKRMGFSLSSPTPFYVWLAFDGFRLLLSQPEVRVLEPVLDVEAVDTPERGVGWLPFAGRRWPVYCLTRVLRPVPELPAERRVCAVLVNGEGYWGLACEEVGIVESKAVILYPMPKCMQQPQAPAMALAVLEGQIVMVSSVPRLTGYLEIGSPSHPARVQALEEVT
jgi:hypothetical protein